jgi:hypothetical protein
MRSQSGQVFPILLAVMLATLALGFAIFQVARAAVQRSDAQTAADAASLAGVREVRDQLAAQVAETGTSSLARINDGAVRRVAEDYASRNGASVVDFERLGIDVRVNVTSDRPLGDQARPVDAEDERAEARARSTLGVSYAGGSALPTPVGGAGGSAGELEVPTEEEWDDLGEEIGDEAPDIYDIKALGEFLQDHGYQVAENTWFPPLCAACHSAGGYHYKFGGRGAIDVNVCACGNLDPTEVAGIEPILGPIAELGFHNIWNVGPGDHQDHLHTDISGSPSTIGAGSAGPLGTLEDGASTEIRLVSWEGPPKTIATSDQATDSPFGPPDMEVACTTYEVGEDLGVSDRVMLSAFEAAIVESGVKNLNYGDRDSLGVFQQRPSQGWGSAAQILDVSYAARKYFEATEQFDTGQPPGELAQDTQRSAFPERYAQRESQALALIAKVEGGC